VQPGKVSITPSSVQKAMSSRWLRKDRSDGATLTAGGRLCHGKRTVAERLVRQWVVYLLLSSMPCP